MTLWCDAFEHSFFWKDKKFNKSLPFYEDGWVKDFYRQHFKDKLAAVVNISTFDVFVKIK